jgi:hypothetical protein
MPQPVEGEVSEPLFIDVIFGLFFLSFPSTGYTDVRKLWTSPGKMDRG